MIELITVLVIVSIVIATAAPSVRGQIDRYRVQGALNRVVAEIYRTRMTAVSSGGAAWMVLHQGEGRCVERIRIVASPDGVERSTTAEVVLPGFCMRVQGDSILRFNSRGMLKPPARSIVVSDGSTADSVVLSIAGRVRRSY